MIDALHGCPAPAKLNLFLHVTGRRADGYHLLQTAFQLIDYGDLLDFAVRKDGQIRRTRDIVGIPHDEDLIVRAARLLQQETGCALGADLTLHKQLPMGGGLGGGSSDAATTLMALNHLWQTGLPNEKLMQLGLRLGADVPFFIFGRNAFAEGVGECLQAIDGEDVWYLVIEPGVHVPTPAIFSAKDLTRDTVPVRIADFSSQSATSWKNDLQPVAVRLYPEVGHALEWLDRYGGGRMTGSGACVFAAFINEQDALDAASQVPSKWRAWTARALRQHPLTERLVAPRAAEATGSQN